MATNKPAPSQQQILLDLVARVGRPVLHLLFPNDVEAYYMVLELVDADQRTLEYFAFPVTPAEVREEHKEITSVTKTYGGTHVLKTDTFTPRKIMIRGQFERGLRFVGDVADAVGGSSIDEAFSVARTRPKDSRSVRDELYKQIGFKNNEANARIFNSFKTGYGAMKYIERLKELSKKRYANRTKPVFLYLYNPILGGNYLVEFENFVHMQNQDNSNIIPTYEMTFIAVADLNTINKERLNTFRAINILNSIAGGLINRGLKNVGNSISGGGFRNFGRTALSNIVQSPF